MYYLVEENGPVLIDVGEAGDLARVCALGVVGRQHPRSVDHVQAEQVAAKRVRRVNAVSQEGHAQIKVEIPFEDDGDVMKALREHLEVKTQCGNRSEKALPF